MEVLCIREWLRVVCHTVAGSQAQVRIGDQPVLQKQRQFCTIIIMSFNLGGPLEWATRACRCGTPPMHASVP